MKKYKVIVLISISLFVLAMILGACKSTDQNFTYSRDIDSNGYWRGVKASKYVQLPDYKNINIPEDTHRVSDEELQAGIEDLLSEFTMQSESYDRAVLFGDTVNIDYVGKVDGVAFNGGSTEGQGTDVTIGVTQYIEGFLEQLVGHEPNETFDIDVTFPADYHSVDLAGKDAVFTITINYITETKTPELTDEFVMENLFAEYGWTNVDMMRSDITKEISLIKVSDYLQSYLDLHSVVTDVPSIIQNFQEESLLMQYKTYADYYQMSLDSFLQDYVGISGKQELLDEYAKENSQLARIYLIMQAVAEKEGLKVGTKELDNYFVNYMKTTDYSQFEEIYGLNYLKLTALMQMVTDQLESYAVYE